jgi:hypothetical protein
MFDLDSIRFKHWESDVKPRWPEYRVKRESQRASHWIEQHVQRILWIYCNCESPLRHCRWVLNEDHAQYRFRYERDMLRFMLIL